MTSFRDAIKSEGTLLVLEALAIAFLILNFRQDFGTAFLGLAFLQLALMFLENIQGGYTVSYSFLKDNNVFKSLMYAAIIFVIFAGASIVLQQISFQSVLNLQSTRAPIFEKSVVTGNLAQSFLVPLVENLVFFGVGLEFVMSLALGVHISLGLIDKLLSLLGTTKAELLSALLVSSAFVIFHLTAKISLGVPGIISTFLFGMAMSYASLKLKATAPGIGAHMFNNLLASGLLHFGGL